MKKDYFTLKIPIFRRNRKSELAEAYNKLSLKEKESYHNILSHYQYGFNINFIAQLLLLPFYFIFYTGIFVIVTRWAFNIDYSPILSLIAKSLFPVWYFNGLILFIFVLFIIVVLSERRYNKIKRRLLLKR